ncbi:MAG: DNA translocase FtsK 4TM domain-containing protein [Patescibacteria group bacterium]
MARKKKNDSKEKEEESGRKKNKKIRLSEETKHSVFAVICIALSFFFVLAAWGKSGVVGSFIYRMLDTLLGVGFFMLPLLLLLLGIAFFRAMRPEIAAMRLTGSALFFLSGLGWIALVFQNGSGGLIGRFVSAPLVSLFDSYATFLFLGAIFVISILLMFDARLSFSIPKFTLFKNGMFGKDTDSEFDGEDSSDAAGEDLEQNDMVTVQVEESEKDENAEAELKEIKPEDAEEPRHMSSVRPIHPFRRSAYTPPPISLLSTDKGKPGVGDIKANANIIRRTLQNFGIHVEMDEITVGPSVTRYALKPAEGVKLSRIVALQNDLGLALAAHPLRIEAPIPGKSLVGIEVPNTTRSVVGLAGLLSAPEYQSSEKSLVFALGKNISGKSFYGDLAKLPHMLIAGATGSGKSVAIHAVIMSLLYRNSPDMLRFIMIDPKRVELTLYNKIPHLLTPVVTDAKKTILALKWAVKEMDRRYDILEAESVRDVASYHKNIAMPAYEKAEKSGGDSAELPEQIPYIVIIIDELADIMATYPRELESAIVRLAQMSRAVGIHLVLSTQRPSVNVITGLIKANIPGRVALQVASQIDSRTILDAGGAEKLLGAGDMLYLSGEMAQPVRLQSAFVSETEVKKVVKFLAEQKIDVADELVLGSGNGGSGGSPTLGSIGDIIAGGNIADGDDDDLYEDARIIIMEAGKASTSYLQRRLKIGYARAARLMDMLEDRGVIGPSDGAKPRDVLAARESEGYGESEQT